MENLGYKEGSTKPKNRQLSRITIDPAELAPLTSNSRIRNRRPSLSLQLRTNGDNGGQPQRIESQYPTGDFGYVEAGPSPPAELIPSSIWDTFNEPTTKLNTKICKDTIRSNLTEEMKLLAGRTRLLNEIEQSDINVENISIKFEKSTQDEQNISLLWSAFLKRSELLKPLILAGADLDYIDPNGMSAIHLAAFSGCLLSMEYLLNDEKIDVNSQPKWYTPLHCAVFGNSFESVKLLIEHGADLLIDTKKENGGEESSLHCAVRSNALECVELLINEGSDVNSLRPNGTNPIHLAADLGLSDCLALLLKCPQANPNIRIGKNESTALHLAADEGNIECVNLLLEYGANAKLKNHRCFTALHLAARTSSLECVESLLKYGKANPNAEDFDQRTPLHGAISKSDSSFDIIETLITWGANVNQTDIFGYTALHLAALDGLAHIVEMLIFYDADVTKKSKKGISALNIISRKTPDSLEMIKHKFDSAISIPYDGRHNSGGGGGGSREVEMELDFRPLLQHCHPREISYLNSFVEEGRKEFLEHPLCSAFLYVKLAKIRKFFLIRLAFCFVTVIFLSLYVLTALAHSCYNGSKDMNETIRDQELCQKQSILGDMLRHNPFVIEMQWWVLVVIIIIEIIRKSYGITGYSSVRHYVTQIENIIEWFVILSVFLTSYIYNNRTDFWQNHIAAFAVLLGWTNLMLMIGKLPEFGVYVSMYTKVQGEFTKLFMAYSCMLIGFTISFCIVYPSNPVFANPLMGFITVLVMTTGEHDLSVVANDPNGTDPPVLLEISAQITFVLFVFFVTIIMWNLLTGTAVDDIQVLKKTAELSKLVQQTELISYIESALFKRYLPEWFSKRLYKMALVSPQVYTRVVLLVKPLNPAEKRLPHEMLELAYEVAKQNKYTDSVLSASMTTDTASTVVGHTNELNEYQLNNKINENTEKILLLSKEIHELKLCLLKNNETIKKLFNNIKRKSYILSIGQVDDVVNVTENKDDEVIDDSDGGVVVVDIDGNGDGDVVGNDDGGVVGKDDGNGNGNDIVVSDGDRIDDGNGNGDDIVVSDGDRIDDVNDTNDNVDTITEK